MVLHLSEDLVDVSGCVYPIHRALSQVSGPHLRRVAALGDAAHDDVAVGDDPVQSVVRAAVASVSFSVMHSAPGCMMSRARRTACGSRGAMPGCSCSYVSRSAITRTTASRL